MASRSLFGVDPERGDGMQLVRDRWARVWVPMGAEADIVTASGDTLAAARRQTAIPR
jgi:hypothetical protein